MARKGIASAGDVFSKLADGTDTNEVWAEFTQTLSEANAKRGALIDLLTFRTTAKSATVLQSPDGTAEFEDASEYGVPQAHRAEAAVIELGYDFRWRDFATRYTLAVPGRRQRRPGREPAQRGARRRQPRATWKPAAGASTERP